jgi:hypothetical protein
MYESASRLSRLTQSYVDALVRQGDNFDRAAWLNGVRQQDGATNKGDGAIASDDIKLEISGPAKCTATSFLNKRAASLSSVNKPARRPHFPGPPGRCHPKDRKASIERQIVAVEAVWKAVKNKRKRDAMYSYLAAVFELATEYQGRGRVKTLLQYTERIMGRRIGDPFSAIIRCTCDADIDRKTVSRWSRALRYVAEFKPAETPLKTFMKRKGGINACADRFARMRKRRASGRQRRIGDNR